MDASQYKDYVLVLLFVKYVSDNVWAADAADVCAEAVKFLPLQQTVSPCSRFALPVLFKQLAQPVAHLPAAGVR
jgi:hypothetical protein